ncbi:MAG: arsenate reductase ArsC [Nevskiales bacterium]
MAHILFLCTGNSCRSQMAEGWARHMHGTRHQFYSAGVEKHGLNPTAVQVMREADVDISAHTSKTLAELGDTQLDTVFTVCGHADETCPVFPAAVRKIHVGFDDPPKLARSAKNEAEALGHYRRVRDEIRDFVAHLDDYL